MRELRFTLEGAAPVPQAASPQLGLTLRIRSGAPVQSVLLRTSVRIEAGARNYSEVETRRLVELFGDPSLWTRGSRSLLWAQVTSVVSAFEGETDVVVALPCTYELTHAVSKYLRALDGGRVPLRALFAGTVFSHIDGALSAAPIAHAHEADLALPVEAWQAAVDEHMRGSALISLRRELFDRLEAARVARGLPTMDACVEDLL